MPRKIYISKRCGRLANRMVLFANMIAFAEEYKFRLRNYTFHSYCKDFESTRNDFHCQYPPPKRKPFLNGFPFLANILIGLRLYYRIVEMMSRHPNLYNATTLKETDSEVLLDEPDYANKLASAKTIFLHGWKYRCPSLTEKHKKIIQNYFRPIARHREAAEEVVNALRHDSEIVIGIHIRQGDYEHWKNGRFYFTSQEYADLMRSFIAINFPRKRVSFLICSNEAQDESLFDGLSIATGPGHPVSDLYSLSLCDYLIGPLSTFTQWASFYGEVPLFHLGRDRQDINLSAFKVADLRMLHD